MLNEEKVKCMTKAAAYENGPEKKNIKIDNYFRGDYIGLQMVKSAFAYTAAFCIMTALGMMGQDQMEEILLNVSHASYLENILKMLIALYICGLVLYEAVIYGYYSVKYQNAKQSVKKFHSCLKRIHKFYETEESVEEKVTDEEKKL